MSSAVFSSLNDWWQDYSEKYGIDDKLPKSAVSIQIFRLTAPNRDSLLIQLASGSLAAPEALLEFSAFLKGLSKPITPNFLLLNWTPSEDYEPDLKRFFFAFFVDRGLRPPHFEISIFASPSRLFVISESPDFFKKIENDLQIFLEVFGLTFDRFEIVKKDFVLPVDSIPDRPLIEELPSAEEESPIRPEFTPASFRAQILKRTENGYAGELVIDLLVDTLDEGVLIRARCSFAERNNFARLKADAWFHFKCRKRTQKSGFRSERPSFELLSFAPAEPLFRRYDRASEKRIELRLHTKMSAHNGVTEAKRFLEAAAAWKHSAIAFTDHENVHNFFKLSLLQKSFPEVQIVYGCDINLALDSPRIASGFEKIAPESSLRKIDFIMLDLETSGLSPFYNEIIEVGMIRFRDSFAIAKSTFFVASEKPIPKMIFELTGIDSAEYEKKAIPIAEAGKRIREFIGSSPLVAHNAEFDIAFLNAFFSRFDGSKITNPIVDTMRLAQAINPGKISYRLERLARFFGLEIDKNRLHRALFDAQILTDVFSALCRNGKLETVRCLLAKNAEPKLLNYSFSNSATILVASEEGIKNLFRIVSESHTKTLCNKKPTVFHESLKNQRSGLLLGSGGFSGQVFTAAAFKLPEDLERTVQFFDYIEIQPPEIYRVFEDRETLTAEQIRDSLRRIIAVAKRLKKPVIATGDVFFLDPEDGIYRDIYIHNKMLRGARHPLFDRKLNRAISLPQFLRTTREMKEAFAFLDDPRLVHEIVVLNPQELLRRIRRIVPVREEAEPALAALEGASERFQKEAQSGLKRRYGDIVPESVKKRFDLEQKRVSARGYETIFLLARSVVAHSTAGHYLVGSRGSVGSSFLAFCLDISEVNPLLPHYFCRSCLRFEEGDVTLFDSGYDLPKRDCPDCRKPMQRDGQKIDFSSFLPPHKGGIPDIDLNFSGRFQEKAVAFLSELVEREFGELHIFRAGTISTVKERTAFALYRNFLDLTKAKEPSPAEMERIIFHTSGTKRTTGQHPGGLMLIPRDREVYDFTPFHYPSNNRQEGLSTHFDYRALHHSLMKIDLLGHDDPTGLRILSELTGVEPLSIPLVEPEVIRIFSSSRALGLRPVDRPPCSTGSLGIPEFGTDFVRRILREREVRSFSDLISLSGLSHGKNVWENNAASLLREHPDWTFRNIIACRDDIIFRLVEYGVDWEIAFAITNRVRKGKALDPEQLEAMTSAGVPEWFIKSCQKIGYLFPKAHATAYSLMAYRFAWYKLYRPAAFYAVYFSLRCSVFELETIRNGREAISARRSKILKTRKQGRSSKEQILIGIFEVAEEMCARGIRLANIDIQNSHPTEFRLIDETTILPPLTAIELLGSEIADRIVAERPFKSTDKERFRKLVNKTIFEKLGELGALEFFRSRKQLSFNFK